MGLPGHRRTSSHKRRRASHFALQHQALTKCAKCGKDVLPHHACGFCGYYGGREVIAKKLPISKKYTAKTMVDTPKKD